MHASYDYAILRVVPRVERAEFVNVGVLVACQQQDFLDVRIELDVTRLRALDPGIDLATVRRHLDAVAAICAGGAAAGALGRLSRRERFDWLTAPRSALIQTSPVHSGRCLEPAATLERLLQTMVRVAPAD